MRLHVRPLAESDLEEAVSLLASWRSEVGAAEPALPSAFAAVEVAASDLRRQLAEPEAAGVAAFRGGRMVGFAIGQATPTLRGRTARVLGYALAGDEDGELLRDLYAALAPAWVAAGYFTHDVPVPACDRRAVEAWFSLGFGRQRCQALRATEPPIVAGDHPSLRIREATAGDIEEITRLSLALQQHHTTSPMFQPSPPEARQSRREQVDELLADPIGKVWLGELDGRVVGMMAFSTLHALVAAPEHCIYLAWGYTEPQLRGGGVGRALLARSLAWMQEAGYAWCLLNFLSANVPAARFWLGNGFRPLAFGLSRTVDERIVWARG